VRQLRHRIMRLEKQAGVFDAHEMTDSELVLGLRRMFQADPKRRWEEELPAMGWGLSRILVEVRAAGPAGVAP